MAITTDGLRFVTEFFEVISDSASHIYHSALQLAPASSIIRKLYRQQISSAARVVTGIPSSWDSCTAIAGATSGPHHAIWSPCGQYIATDSGNEIKVQDSTTLEISYLLFKPPGLETLYPNLLAFSPDGHLIICEYRDIRSGFLPSFITLLIVASSVSDRRSGKLVAWDTQTGIFVKELRISYVERIGDDGHQRMCEFTGRVHTFLRDDTLNAEEKCGDQQISRHGLLGPHWTREGSLYFSTCLETSDRSAITIREFQPTLTPSHPVVESFHVPHHGGKFSFSPFFFHASFVTRTNIVILDVRDSNILLRTKDEGRTYEYSPGFFSPDGRFFACKTLRRGISIWKNTPDGYIPWSSVRPRLPCKGFSFSPTATSILTWGPEGIQLLNPGDRVRSFTFYSFQPNLQDGDHLVTSSADGTRIATARRGGCAVTILDSLSGTSQQSFSTRSEIQGLGFVQDAVLVLSEHSMARWSLKGAGVWKSEMNFRTLGDMNRRVGRTFGHTFLVRANNPL